MKEQVKKLGDKLLNSNSLVFTFMRSVCASQAASWVDLGTGFVLFSFAHFLPWVSTAIGAVAGGIINCIINYKFTFHAQDCPWKAVMVKYALVWLGSILLNSWGTQFVYYLLEHWTWLETIGFRPDGYYAAARLVVSLIVSWAWNFVLQRNFVYRKRKFDSSAIAFVNYITRKRELPKDKTCGAKQ